MCERRRTRRLPLIAAFALLATTASADPIVGACRFDVASLAFAGKPADQAACLLRHPEPGGRLPAAPARLPRALRSRLDRPVRLDIDAVARVARKRGLPADFVDRLADPVSHARDGDPSAPSARYFVIHDTSEPYLGAAPAFPADIDASDAVNDLTHYLGPNAVAHVFTNRRGEMVVGHDFSVPWRATQLESKVIGIPAKGLFLHVENQQPRRADPDGPSGNDRIAPVPGLSPVQYDILAMVYVVASVRAGRWLIPAFHAAIDEGLPDAHDDPQHFDLAAFDAAVTRALKTIGRSPPPR
jgi:hypothetical protein